MASDADMMLDVGFIILGFVLFIIPDTIPLIQLIAFALIIYGGGHIIFNINLMRGGKRK